LDTDYECILYIVPLTNASCEQSLHACLYFTFFNSQSLVVYIDCSFRLDCEVVQHTSGE